MKNKTIVIITGEASGDVYGAQLVKEIFKKSKGIKFYGMGSLAMESAGVDIMVDSRNLSVMGITEVVHKIPLIISSIRKIKELLRKLKPGLLILIDFPDFNFIIASLAKKLKIPILYYVGPQIWAWRKGRIKKIKRLIDRMAVIFPFEEKFYKRHGVSVTFVGHPIMDVIKPSLRSKIYDKSKFKTVGLLPGSRNKEISKLLPVMLESAKLIKQSIDVKFILSKFESIDNELFSKIIKKYKGFLDVEIYHGSAQEMFSKCDFLIAASGTVTLEAALYNVPMLVIYKVSMISHLIGKILIDIEHIGIVNLILESRVVPELIQNQASCYNISRITKSLLEEEESLNKIKQNLIRVGEYLGSPGASKKVADIAIEMLF